MRVRPFPALRPRPDVASRVASVPYDVVNRAEAKALADADPLSFMHVIRPEVDLPADTSPYDDAVYNGGSEALQGLTTQGVLVREEAPALYVYAQQATIGGRDVRQAGVVACCHIEDYEQGLIKRHEKTRQDKEDDRTRHVLSLAANAGPVFLLHRPESALSDLLERYQQQPPLYDFTAEDGVRHEVWRIDDPSPVLAAFERIPQAYVADGHHRSASAARAGATLRARNPNHDGSESYNWFLCVLFSADQLHVLPYHRVVKDLNGLSPQELLERLAEVGSVAPCDEPQPPQTGCFGMFLDGRGYRITLPDSSIDRSDAVASLDYVLLYERVLAPLLGIGEIRTDPRIDFVGGIRGTGELERRVRSGEHAVAFAMHATTIDQLMGVADAGQIMPPKSTWFEPKLRSGLLIHTLD